MGDSQGESGHRPMEVDWARELRDKAIEADVAFFFKQWGGHTRRLAVADSTESVESMAAVGANAI